MKTLKYLALFLSLSSVSVKAADYITTTETDFDSDFKNRFSLSAGVNSSLTKASDLKNFSFSYGRQLESVWIDTNVVLTSGLFGELSENHPAATGTVSDDLFTQENTLTTIGVGIGRETRYAQTLIPINDLYEFMAANLTYNMYKEDFSGKTFNGPGLLAKFELHKRFGNHFSAGAHFNYTLAVVKRSQENDLETSSDRSLTLGFLALGFNISLYL